MTQFQTGDLVAINSADRDARAGVVAGPTSEGGNAHVLTFADGHVQGVDVGMEDIEIADESVEGWAQLAHTLIRLGSHIIEERLLVYRT